MERTDLEEWNLELREQSRKGTTAVEERRRRTESTKFRMQSVRNQSQGTPRLGRAYKCHGQEETTTADESEIKIAVQKNVDTIENVKKKTFSEGLFKHMRNMDAVELAQ